MGINIILEIRVRGNVLKISPQILLDPSLLLYTFDHLIDEG